MNKAKVNQQVAQHAKNQKQNEQWNCTYHLEKSKPFIWDVYVWVTFERMFAVPLHKQWKYEIRKIIAVAKNASCTSFKPLNKQILLYRCIRYCLQQESPMHRTSSSSPRACMGPRGTEQKSSKQSSPVPLCWDTHWSTEMWEPTLSLLRPSITTLTGTLCTACQNRTPCFTCSINAQPSWLDVFHLFPVLKDLLWQWHSMGTWVRPNVSSQNRQAKSQINNKCCVANDQGHSSPHMLTGQESPQSPLNISSGSSIHMGQVYPDCSHRDP